MTANLTRPRPDIVYLRRRLKPGETPPVVEAAPRSNLLNLGGSESVPEAVLPSVPLLTSETVLSASEPACRLSKVSSGVGSLVFTNVSYVGWQMLDGTTGFLYASDSPARSAEVLVDGVSKSALPEIPVGSRKNRAHMEFHKGFFVVSLRAVRELKRLIVVPKDGLDVQAATQNQVSVTLPFESGTVMYCSVVDSQVEFRYEKYRNSVHETFRVGTYAVPTPQTTNALRDAFSGGRR